MELMSGRTVLSAAIVNLPDAAADPHYDPRSVTTGHWRRMLGVPIMLEGRVLGALVVCWRAPGETPQQQIDLLQTFADQAVIAIENTRLFEQVQARTQELTESLEYQTATSEVLNVISRSPIQIQPVFEAIISSAAALCGAAMSNIQLYDGEYLHVAAMHNFTSEAREKFRNMYPMRPDRVRASGRAILTRSIVHVPDILTDPEYPKELAIAGKWRALLSVPMLREGKPLGVVTVAQVEPGPFSERQVNLLRTFADQAVIAIENTRLFEAEQASKRDLQEALQQQTATADVLAVISSSIADPRPVFDRIVASCERLFAGKQVGINLLGDDGMIRVGAYHGPGREGFEKLFPITVTREFGSGRAILERRILHYPDVMNGSDVPEGMKRGCVTTGIKACIFAPLLWEGRGLGAIFVGRDHVGALPEKDIALLQTFADQAVIAIENTRLFEQVQARTRELAKTVEDLEIASQHKSQFVANMSHELRTPLAAILGYAELMQEGFYEAQGPKSLDALTRIRSNGKHLLGLINTVLDIAKIESGQFSLNLAEYALSSVVETVRAATESLAETKRIALMTHVPRSLPVGFGDEQRLTQVLLNLVGNAIKFTDTGEVRITAKTENGHFAVSVADTGPGIPADQLTRVFEQFHQVDNSNTKKKGGTGLGLAIAKQIVEMHGGRVWAESEPGKGATFLMQLPVRAESRKALQ
jgi:signal transduction histidine kinase